MTVRSLVIVLDGCGVGAAPDWNLYGDEEGANTLLHVMESGNWKVPHLTALGLFPWLEATGLEGFAIEHGSLQPMGFGKDSVTGHWEMMGAVVQQPFPTFPNGFPASFVEALEERIGRPLLGNVVGSGTEILSQFGAESLERELPIVYTSADSVLQIAAHEDVIPVSKLYEWCRLARELSSGKNGVQRVIARPFTGDCAPFRRTDARRDFVLSPPSNLCDTIGDVVGIGVVAELFDHRGFRTTPRTGSNSEHEEALLAAMQEQDSMFIFANFEDFDMRFGHRNDPIGFGKCLEEFDITLHKVLASLQDSDELVLTADHGNDPLDFSTDHTREYVPFVKLKASSERSITNLGTQQGLAHVGRAVATHLSVSFNFD
ncbi:MAG: phosphopentomutase [Armatimonadota bacterium]